MSGPGHGEFEARIKRIEEKRGNTGAPTTKDSGSGQTPPKSKRAPIPKGGNSRVIALVALILVIVGGGFAFTQLGAGSKITRQASVGGGSILAAAQEWLTEGPLQAKRSKKNKTPEAVRTLTDQGWVIESPGVASADRAELSLAEIAQPGSPVHDEPAMTEVASFDVNETCDLRRPEKNEAVHNVRLGHGNIQTDVHVLSNSEMAVALMKHIKGVTSRNKPYLIGSMANHPMAAVDVFVTDTSSPVFLVLQGFSSDTIWNLQLADGVDISHVAMIGENSGLAGLPDGASFEALRISDFVTDFEFGSNEEIAPCMIAPWRPAEPHWLGYQKAQKGNALFENQMYSYNTGARAFGEWYSQALGRDASENLVSVKAAGHVLVGPKPETPVTIIPLSGRSIHITRNDRIIRGAEALKQAHEGLLSAAVGGDIALLNPEPMEGVRK